MEDRDGVMNEITEKAEGGSKEAGWIMGRYYSKELRINNSEEKGDG